MADFIKWNAELTKVGSIVLSISCVLHDKDANEFMADRLDDVHKRKIDISHCVLVMDPLPDVYTGKSTASELEYAESRQKEVFRLSKWGVHEVNLEDELRRQLCITPKMRFDRGK